MGFEAFWGKWYGMLSNGGWCRTARVIRRLVLSDRVVAFSNR